MTRFFKWMLPATAVAAFGLALGTMSWTAKAQSQPAGKGHVTGTVLDKDGKPAAGVEVRLTRGGGGRRGGGGGGGGAGGPPPAPQDVLTPDASMLQQQPGGGGGGGGGRGGPPVATATTDKDGKFEMKDVPAGMYGAVVRDDAKKLYGVMRVTVEADKTATVEIKCTDTPPQRRGGGGGGGGAPPQQ